MPRRGDPTQEEPRRGAEERLPQARGTGGEGGGSGGSPSKLQEPGQHQRGPLAATGRIPGETRTVGGRAEAAQRCFFLKQQMFLYRGISSAEMRPGMD